MDKKNKRTISRRYQSDDRIHAHTDADGNVRFHTHSHSHDHTHEHEHTHEQDHGHSHSHSHGHSHGHMHTHTETKRVLNRLSRASGHLDAVRKMVEEGRDCSEVLIQLAAVISALNSTGKVILKDHLSHCIVDAVASGDQKPIDDLTSAIDTFIK